MYGSTHIVWLIYADEFTVLLLYVLYFFCTCIFVLYFVLAEAWYGSTGIHEPIDELYI